MKADIVDVTEGNIQLKPGVEYPLSIDGTSLVGENIDKVIFPENGNPWIERDPFDGREEDQTIIQDAQTLVDDAYVLYQEDTKEPTLEEWREQAVITRFQAKVALDNIGLLDDIEAYMEDPDTPKLRKMAWKEGIFMRRSQMVEDVGALFNLTPEDIDQLFIDGATIEV